MLKTFPNPTPTVQTQAQALLRRHAPALDGVLREARALAAEQRQALDQIDNPALRKACRQ